MLLQFVFHHWVEIIPIIAELCVPYGDFCYLMVISATNGLGPCEEGKLVCLQDSVLEYPILGPQSPVTLVMCLTWT